MDFFNYLTWALVLGTSGFITFKLFVRYGYKSIMVHLLVSFIAPAIFYPFAYSRKNIDAIGGAYGYVVMELPGAWLIYGSLCLITFLALYWTVRRAQVKPTDYPLFSQTIRSVIASKPLFTTVFAIHFLLTAVLVLNGMQYGAGLSMGIANPQIRPILNIWQVWTTFCLLMLIGGAYVHQTAYTITLAVLAVVMAGLTGQRSVIFFPLIVIMCLALSHKNIRISLKPILFLALAIPIAVQMQNYRYYVGLGEKDRGSESNVLESVAYGNQFSEVRDFAWIIASYNGPPLMGKTFLSGYTSFIPSSLMPSRQKWAFGRWTATQADLDTRYHPGLRGGPYSEIYFNFGYVISVVFAALTGFILGKLLLWESANARSGNRLRSISTGIASYLMAMFWLDVIFSVNFFYVFVISAFLVVVHFLPKRRRLEAAPRRTNFRHPRERMR